MGLNVCLALVGKGATCLMAPGAFLCGVAFVAFRLGRQNSGRPHAATLELGVVDAPVFHAFHVFWLHYDVSLIFFEPSSTLLSFQGSVACLPFPKTVPSQWLNKLCPLAVKP